MKNSGMGPALSRRVSAGIWKLRQDQNMTQTELGVKAGRSQATVSQAERRAAGVSLEILRELAAALGTDLDGLAEAGGAP